LVTSGSLFAETFERTRIAPDQGIDVLHRGVARERVGRDLFSNPYATVTIGQVDVYDVFPYVEARHFQIVSDPRWNRLVFGEVGQSLRAFDGAGSPMGALSEPRGMAVSEDNRVFVADAGNDRVVVFSARTEYGDMELVPLYAIEGLHDPHGVAFSDGGTPFQPADDVLYVADTGKNRVVAFALESNRARQVAEIGDLGSGPDRFAGPTAISAGRVGGANTRDVFVADAHNQRIVRLTFNGDLRWVSEHSHGADVLTSLETDHWGNLYAAAPNQGVVHKFALDLTPVARLQGAPAHPKNFHVPFFNVRDHRNGKVVRSGQPNGLTIENWTDVSGLKLWNLGVEVNDLAVVAAGEPEARFMLTDRAVVSIEIVDGASGRLLSRRTVGTLDAGAHDLALLEDDLRGAKGETYLRLAATSTYADGRSTMAQAAFQASGTGSVLLPDRLHMLGNTPNPFAGATRIAFLVPAGSDKVSLRVYDAMGRLVRSFDQAFAPGYNEVVWDGRDQSGGLVRTGVYFSRLDRGDEQVTDRMIVVR
jgi:hypothetical protein